MSSGATNRQPPPSERRPFRAADVLTGAIDQRRRGAGSARARKQISAQLEPAQVRLLGELHARLNATAGARIEKSDLVGLGIELLAVVLDGTAIGDANGATEGEFAPAPDDTGRGSAADAAGGPISDLASLRAYAHTHVRRYGGRR